jgi:hypothetical protein
VKTPVCCTGVGSSFGFGVGAARAGRARLRARRGERCTIAVWLLLRGVRWARVRGVFRGGLWDLVGEERYLTAVGEILADLCSVRYDLL